MGPDSHQTWYAPRAPPTTTFYKTSSHSLSPFLRYAPFIVICLSMDINQVSFSSLSLVDRGHPKSSRSSSAAFSVEAIGRCDRSLRAALFVILVAFLIGLAVWRQLAVDGVASVPSRHAAASSSSASWSLSKLSLFWSIVR